MILFPCGAKVVAVALPGRRYGHAGSRESCPRALDASGVGRPKGQWDDLLIRLVGATWWDGADTWPCRIAAE